MGFLSERDADYLRRLFAERLTDPVTVKLFTRESKLLLPGVRDCPTCRDTRLILEELAGLSENIRLEVHDVFAEPELARQAEIFDVPAVIIEGKNAGRVRFFGLPAGYEFATLVEDLVDVSRGETALAGETRRQLAGLLSPVLIRVLVTPT
jgi:glutaredoxin